MSLSISEIGKLLTREPQVYEFSALATYNAERARGIVHTREWQEKMRLEQERFDRQRENGDRR